MLPYKWKNRIERFNRSPIKFGKAFYRKKIVGRNVTAPRDTKEVFKQLTDFARHYDVNSIEVLGEKAWPFLRGHLWVALNTVSISDVSKSKQRLNPLSLNGCHFTQFNSEFVERVKRRCNAKEISEITEQDQADFLFFPNLNGTEQIDVNGKLYYRLVDPIYEAALELGCAKKVKIVRSFGENYDRWGDQLYMSDLILPPRIRRFGYTHEMKFNKSILAYTTKYLSSIDIRSFAEIKNVLEHEFHMRDVYKKVLQAYSPKVVFLYGYHYKAALISAANELGILTVDLQHGLQIGWNPLYNNHDEMPVCGYASYPDYFAVWGNQEYENINKTFGGVSHKPILMGNPWIERMVFKDAPISHNVTSKIANYRLPILVIMQNQPTVPDTLKMIIDSTIEDDEILWVIRHHPIGKRFTSIDFSENPNILIDPEIDSTLFTNLFDIISVAVSEGSAMAREAAHFGVENIIFGDLGRDNYAYEINNEDFYFIREVEDFHLALSQIKNNVYKGNKKLLTTPPFAKVQLKEMLSSLLVAANNKASVKPSFSYNFDLKIEKTKKLEYLAKSIDVMVLDRDLDGAIKTFYEFRRTLEELPNANELYEIDRMLRAKEAKVFARAVSEKYDLNQSKSNVFMVADSLGLPRIHETKEKGFGVSYTVAGNFNASQSKFKMEVWAQRYLTTEKLVKYWHEIVPKDLEAKHFVLHLGLNDSSERIFLERQRLALSNLGDQDRKFILKFVKKYRKQIILGQNNHAYVPVELFEQNLQEIMSRLSMLRVASINVVNIIAFPNEHEVTTPKSRENTAVYNSVINKVCKQVGANVIDLNELVYENGFDIMMLNDMMHPSHEGNVLLAKKLTESFCKSLSM